MSLLLLIFHALMLTSTGCNKEDKPQPPIVEPDLGIGKAQVWLTRGDQMKLFSKEADLTIYNQNSQEWPIITIDTAITFQTVDGYGAALTGSSAYLINRKLDQAARTSLLNQLFDPEQGIGISFLRLTMGASDFSLRNYTYNDIPTGETDFNLDQFSLSDDLDDVVPVMQAITSISPDIFIMGSPWSPPAWMKTNGSLAGGRLKENCYSVYADYFVKYIQQMQANGIRISHLTPQNEPLYFAAAYPCMEMQSEEQSEFIKNHLGPKLNVAGLDTKIINYDHNWDVTDYSINILNDAEARQYTAGSAFHGYAGSVSAMSTVHNAHPDKELHFTEISGGEWATDFSDNLLWYMRNIFIGTAKNWSRSALMWNLALDEQYGPRNNGCSNCRGVVTINQSSGKVTFNEEYYAIGHFSKVVRSGAQRVSLLYAQSLGNIEVVAFVNTDGSKALIFANYEDQYKTFTIHQNQKYFNYSVPGKAVVSISWR